MKNQTRQYISNKLMGPLFVAQAQSKGRINAKQNNARTKIDKSRLCMQARLIWDASCSSHVRPQAHCCSLATQGMHPAREERRMRNMFILNKNTIARSVVSSINLESILMFATCVMHRPLVIVIPTACPKYETSWVSKKLQVTTVSNTRTGRSVPKQTIVPLALEQIKHKA